MFMIHRWTQNFRYILSFISINILSEKFLSSKRIRNEKMSQSQKKPIRSKHLNDKSKRKHEQQEQEKHSTRGSTILIPDNIANLPPQIVSADNNTSGGFLANEFFYGSTFG